MAATVIRTLTSEEINRLYGWPPSKIYRLASIDRWRRINEQRPVLYNADDVDTTAARLEKRGS